MDKQSLGRRRDTAIQTIADALGALGTGADIPPFVSPGIQKRYDADHNLVILLERIAEYAAQVAGAVDASPSLALDHDDYSVSGLRKLVEARGLDLPDGATRADLISILESA